MKTQGSVLERCITNFLILFTFLGATEALALPRGANFQNEASGQRGLIFGPELFILDSDQNRGPNGDTQNLSRNGSAQIRDFALKLQGDLSPSLLVFGKVGIRSAQFQQSGASELKQSGLSDQLLGASYEILPNHSASHFRLQAGLLFPLYSNPDAKRIHAAYLGDESTDLTAGGFFTHPFHFGGQIFESEMGIAYRYRFQGYSAALPFRIGLALPSDKNGIQLGVHWIGQLSLNSDQNTFSNQGSYGSQIVGAINPSFSALEFLFGYRFQNGIRLSAEFDLLLSGRSIPLGTPITLAASIPLGTEKPSEESLPPPNRPENEVSAKVTSTHDGLYLLKINKGSHDEVVKGQIFDIYDGEKKIARAQVTHVKDEEAALAVLEYFQDQWIEKGFIARSIIN